MVNGKKILYLKGKEKYKDKKNLMIKFKNINKNHNKLWKIIEINLLKI